MNKNDWDSWDSRFFFKTKTLAAQVLISMGQDKQNAREASLQLPEMGRHKKDNLKKEEKTTRQ